MPVPSELVNAVAALGQAGPSVAVPAGSGQVFDPNALPPTAAGVEELRFTNDERKDEKQLAGTDDANLNVVLDGFGVKLPKDFIIVSN